MATNTEDHIAEHVPWEQLAVHPPPDRRRLIYAAAGGLVIAALAVAGVRQYLLPAPSFAPIERIDEAGPPSSVIADVRPAIAPPPTAPIWSEADLMAIDPAAVERRLAAAAEMVVLEFFTLDPGDDWAGRVGAITGWQVPESARPTPPEPEAVSYVEWVSATAADQTATGRYTVTVAMRRMTAADGAAYRRHPVEWVALDLRIGQGEAVAVLTLPRSADPLVVEVTEFPGAAGRQIGPGGIGWPRS